MIVSWILLAVFIIEVILLFVVTAGMRKKKIKTRYRLFASLAFLLLFAITLKYAVFPPAKNIPVTGQYQIASEDYWVQENIEDPYRTDGKLRELQVRKWYPVDCSETKPVIIASHGSCGTIDNNRSLYRELASHGYTVLAVAHPGQAVSVTYENGKKAGPAGRFLKQMTSVQPQKDPEYACEVFREWMDIRTDDLNAVMDDYLATEGAAVFVIMGHSLGGSAAYAMARIREDVTGCIALESPFMFDIVGVKDGEYQFEESDYDIPLLSIYSDSSYPHLNDWQQYKNNIRFWGGGESNYTSIHYEGVGHMGLCDLSLISPLLSALLDGRIQKASAATQLERMNNDIVSWLASQKISES